MFNCLLVCCFSGLNAFAKTLKNIYLVLRILIRRDSERMKLKKESPIRGDSEVGPRSRLQRE